VSVILSKIVCMYMCPIPNGFRDGALLLYSCKNVDKKYYVVLLIPVFVVQVAKLVQVVWYNTFSKIPPSSSVNFATRVRTWRVALRVHLDIPLCGR